MEKNWGDTPSATLRLFKVLSTMQYYIYGPKERQNSNTIQFMIFLYMRFNFVQVMIMEPLMGCEV